jgi:hypothetical protein
MRLRVRSTSLLTLVALVSGIAVAISASALADDSTCFGKAVTVVGTPGDDVIDLTGNPGQVVFTGSGDDVVVGSDGDDVVCLGDGTDRFEGNGGDDQADGGTGDDALRGGPGNDVLVGGEGNDLLKGQQGDDHVSGGAGDDLVRGGSGDDRLNGGDAVTDNTESGDDVIRGGRGYDRLWSNYSSADHDPVGELRGGPDYDFCVNGDRQRGCERDHQYSSTTDDPTQNEWYPLVDEVFSRWGLDQRECAKHKNAEGDRVRFCIPDQRSNAVEVLMCESGGWPFAQNAAGPVGLFQNHPSYWQSRVDHLVETYGSGNTDFPEVRFEPDFPANADPLDPRWSITMAAMLVYEARETILLKDPAPNYPYTMVGGLSYPTFNFDTYAAHYYGRYDPALDPEGDGPTELIYGGYPNGGEGPQPWGQWVSCGASSSVWPMGQGLYDPGWLSPWDGTVEGHENLLPDWWPIPPPSS